MNLKSFVREVKDFPKKGISFKDITTLLEEPKAFQAVINRMREDWQGRINKIVALDARGFIFGAPLALLLDLPLVLARKKGKLPSETLAVEYGLEYGNNTLEMHLGSVKSGDSVLIVDDLLATGGTAKATAELVEKLGGSVAGFAFVIELSFLSGRMVLEKYEVKSQIVYED